MLLRYNLPSCRVALNVENGHLVCWATIDFVNQGSRRPNISAWTDAGHRRKGHAQRTVAVLLRRSKAPKKLNVHTPKMRNLLNGIAGYTPFYPHEFGY